MGSLKEPLLESSEKAIDALEDEIEELLHDTHVLQESITGGTGSRRFLNLGIGDTITERVEVVTANNRLWKEDNRADKLSDREKKQKFLKYQEKLDEVRNEWKVYKHVQKRIKDLEEPEPGDSPIEALGKLHVNQGKDYYQLDEYLRRLCNGIFQNYHNRPIRLDVNDIERRREWHSDESPFPLLEGLWKTVEAVQERKREAFRNLGRSGEYRSRNLSNPERPEITALEPEYWSNIYGFENGDLHKHLEEEEPSEKQSIQHEYPLHFVASADAPVDRSLQPDALEDLCVHEFKQPQNRINPDKLDLEGPKSHTEEEDLKQVNKYLNSLDLPVGILVYVGEDTVTQYVVERSDSEIPPTQNIYRRQDYHFRERLLKKLDDRDSEKKQKQAV